MTRPPAAFAHPWHRFALAARALLLAALVMVLPVLPGAGLASTDASAICDQVAYEASRRTGVPHSVLRAISLTETGRKRAGALRPWPWTVNMEGAGHWFDSEDEARAYVYREYKRGARSFDVGCFQINYRWHGQAFRSIEEMFDPLANALYAARFLQGLHAEQGDWGRAAGAYHSRTPEFANRYQARFERLHAGLGPSFQTGPEAGPGAGIPEIPDIVAVANGGATQDAEPAVARVNRYPLLQTGGAAGLGSLVPLGTGGMGSLFPGSDARPAAAEID